MAILPSQNLGGNINSLSDRIKKVSGMIHSSLYQLTDREVLHTELEDLRRQVQAVKSTTEELFEKLSGAGGVSIEALESSINGLRDKAESTRKLIERIEVTIKDPIITYLVDRISSYVGIDQNGLRGFLESLREVDIQRVKGEVDMFIAEASSDRYSGLKANVISIFSSENMATIISMDTLTTVIRSSLDIYKLLAKCRDLCGNAGIGLLSMFLSRLNGPKAFLSENEESHSKILRLFNNLLQRAVQFMPDGDGQRELVDSMSSVVAGKVFAGLPDIINGLSATLDAFEIALDSREKYHALDEIYSRFKTEMNIEGIYKEQYHDYFGEIRSLKELYEKEMSISLKHLVGCVFNGGCDFRSRGNLVGQLKSKIGPNAKRLSSVLNGEIEILGRLCGTTNVEGLEKEITKIDDSLKSIYDGVGEVVLEYEKLVVSAYEVSQQVFICIGRTNMGGGVELDVSDFDSDIVKVLFDVLKALNKSLVMKVSEK
jgi:hypothetical protein